MVKETSEYRCLQSQFSVLYNESLILKAQLDETRARLNTTRTARLRQLEHMEVRVCLCVVSVWVLVFVVFLTPPPRHHHCVQNDEVALQRKVRTEVFQLEDTLAQVRKEYEMLRIEFEQTLAANEQAGDRRVQTPDASLLLTQPKRRPPFMACFLFSCFTPSLRSHQPGDASPDQHAANPQPADEGRGGEIQDQAERDAGGAQPGSPPPPWRRKMSCGHLSSTV